MDTTQEMFEPLHQMIVMLKQHGVDVSGVQVAEKDVQVRLMPAATLRRYCRSIAHVLYIYFVLAVSLPHMLHHFQYLFCRQHERWHSQV